MYRMLNLLKALNSHFEKISTDIVSSFKLIDATCRSLEILKSTDSSNQIDVDAQLLLSTIDDISNIVTQAKRSRRLPQNLSDSTILYGEG